MSRTEGSFVLVKTDLREEVIDPDKASGISFVYDRRLGVPSFLTVYFKNGISTIFDIREGKVEVVRPPQPE